MVTLPFYNLLFGNCLSCAKKSEAEHFFKNRNMYKIPHILKKVLNCFPFYDTFSTFYATFSVTVTKPVTVTVKNPVQFMMTNTGTMTGEGDSQNWNVGIGNKKKLTIRKYLKVVQTKFVLGRNICEKPFYPSKAGNPLILCCTDRTLQKRFMYWHWINFMSKKMNEYFLAEKTIFIILLSVYTSQSPFKTCIITLCNNHNYIFLNKLSHCIFSLIPLPDFRLDISLLNPLFDFPLPPFG